MKQEDIFVCNQKEEAIQILQKNLQKEDAVLVKASNSCKFIEICEAIC